jgi:hypothetical protein
VLQEHQLFIKCSKCAFGVRSVTYLGHVILGASVVMDEQKIKAVLEWPIPGSTHDVCAFLGLAGYYCHFICEYGTIIEPLTKLLRKGAFRWCAKAKAVFDALKRTLMTAPVLQLPDFDADFIIECGASGTRFSAILHQGFGPVAFYSKAISP